jgi:hypothetical protein
MQLPTHDHARILLALFSHVTFSLPLQKLTTNNEAIYRWLDRLQWRHIYIPPSYLRQRAENPSSNNKVSSTFINTKQNVKSTPHCSAVRPGHASLSCRCSCKPEPPLAATESLCRCHRTTLSLYIWSQNSIHKGQAKPQAASRPHHIATEMRYYTL